MSKGFVEILLFTSVAVNAALLKFFAGVFRKIMNAVDGATFIKINELLFRYSSRSPFMIIALNLPLLIAIPYWYFFGFSNGWITSGTLLWLVSGSISKIIKLPVRKAIPLLKPDDKVQLNQARQKLNRGNLFQAILYSAAVILMLFGLH
jgi:hypothetical protein